MTVKAKKRDFDIPYLKEKIKQTPDDEICILSGGFSYYYRMDEDMWDWLSDKLGHYCYLNDYCDLVCDPHGIDDF